MLRTDCTFLLGNRLAPCADYVQILCEAEDTKPIRLLVILTSCRQTEISIGQNNLMAICANSIVCGKGKKCLNTSSLLVQYLYARLLM